MYQKDKHLSELVECEWVDHKPMQKSVGNEYSRDLL